MSAMTPGRKLLRLVQRQVLIGRPPPFGVRDEHATLLLAKGQTVTDDAHLQALLARGVYVDAEEMLAPAPDKHVVQRVPPERLFGLPEWAGRRRGLRGRASSWPRPRQP